MKLIVRLFARAKDLAGKEQIELQAEEPVTVAELKRVLAVQAPELEAIAPSLLVVVDNEYADNDMIVNNEMRIACFPPVSGG